MLDAGDQGKYLETEGSRTFILQLCRTSSTSRGACDLGVLDCAFQLILKLEFLLLEISRLMGALRDATAGVVALFTRHEFGGAVGSLIARKGWSLFAFDGAFSVPWKGRDQGDAEYCVTQ